jgi:hypothetical protein
MRRPQRRACFLILLLLWAQVDNLWAVLAVPQTRVAVDDDDEYLSIEREPSSQLFSGRQRLFHAELIALPVGLFLPSSREGEATGDSAFRPSGLSSLYVFMSLQR